MTRLTTLDPYALLNGLPHLTLEFVRLPDDEMGRWLPARQTILLDERLSQTERRCTLVHELVHHVSGDRAVDLTPELAAAQERTCRDRAARLLITLPALADAMRWSDHSDEIAEQLWVDEATLYDRLDNLHPDEEAYLRQKVREAREDVA